MPRARAKLVPAPVVLLVLMSLPESPSHAATPDPDFLRTIAETRGFMLGRAVSPSPTPDGREVLFLESGARSPSMSLHAFDVATGTSRVVLAPETLLHGGAEELSPEERARRERMRVTTRGFTSFELSKDGSLVLLALSGRLYLHHRATGATSELPIAPPVIDPRLSPDGRSLAFVRGRDLYVFDLAAREETRLTASTDDAVTNGLAEFVAQEEMDRMRGYWFSPDSARVAFEEADSRGVEELFIADPARPEFAPERSRYPRPGKANAKVRLGVVARTGGAVTWIEWDAARFPYLASVVWQKGAPLALVVMTRDQKEVALLAADAATGRTTRLLAEHDEAWVNLDQSTPRFLPSGGGFLWSSDTYAPRAGGSDTRRLELHDMHGKLLHVLSPIDCAYIKLLHVDERAGEVWFAGATDPTEQHVYRARLDGSDVTRTTREPGLHVATFGEGPGEAGGGGGAVHVVTSMTLDRVHRAEVRRGDRAVGPLPEVAVEPGFVPNVERATVGPDALHALIVRPRGFDPAKRYPVWLDVYGGPHHLHVQAAMQPSLMRQWIADHGFVVVSIDGRGTPHRGRAFERAIRGDFGALPLSDQVAGLRALGAAHREIDASRVGIVGWSFGGYLAALATIRRPDVFTVGVAGAPVVDWRDYDTTYTERYLGLPDENAKGYEASSLLTYAKDLARPLLLIHGTADDNVYFFHTLKLAGALLHAGRPFELLPLPGFTHVVADPVVREKMWDRILLHMKTLHVKESSAR